MARPLKELIAPDWAEALADVEPQIHTMGDFLRQEIAEGRSYLPAGDNVLRAFSRPLAGVRVLIVGQDPYPTPGHAVGLSFSVAPDVRPIPRSLQNIYQELSDDLGIAPAPHGDLTAWFEQGVLLLNRVLTVSPGKAGSHRGKGWEAVTTAADRGWRSSGAATRSPPVPCSARPRSSPAPTRRPCRHATASSAHVRSAARTRRSSSRVPARSTGTSTPPPARRDSHNDRQRPAPSPDAAQPARGCRERHLQWPAWRSTSLGG